MKIPMTQTEYEARNLQGFEGDIFIKEKIKEIIAKHKIKLIVELGTYLGGSTKQFCDMAPEVVTTEIKAEFFSRASAFLKDCKNLKMYCDNSVNALPGIISDAKNKKILFYIDSHWWEACPLLDELQIIADSGIKPVIAIHDFLVPGHPELEFDTWNGKPLDYSFIEQHLHKIYGFNGFRYEYNTRATGASRGIIFVYPK